MIIGKTFLWKPNEIQFLKINYNLQDNKDLAKHFGIRRNMIVHKASSLGLIKKYRVKCQDCPKGLITRSHRVVRCSNCQERYIKKSTKLRLRKLREKHLL